MIGYALAAVVVFFAWIGMVTLIALGFGKAVGLRNRRG